MDTDLREVEIPPVDELFAERVTDSKKIWLEKHPYFSGLNKAEKKALTDNVENLSKANDYVEPNPMFARNCKVYDGKIMYRGDIKDKGLEFTDHDDAKDYIFDGEIKNKANFHWFSNEREYAMEYATKQLSEGRGEIKKSILTTVETRKLNILDLKSMSLSDQVRFHRSLYDYGIKDMNYRQEFLPILGPDDVITPKELSKIFGFDVDDILNNGQAYSDRETGVLFKKWLQDNGFQGYRFQLFKLGDEVGVIDKYYFKIKDREIL